MRNITEITDFNAPELDIYARLTEAQLFRYREPKPGIFVAESPRVIERALMSGYEPISFLARPEDLEGQGKELLSKWPEIPVYTAQTAVLRKLTGFELTRGMLCAMNRRRLWDMGEVCREASRIVVLENVVNPTNVGAIFRSAAALGMDAVLLTHGCSDPLYRRAARVSMGTVFQIPYTILGKEEPWQQRLSEMGFQTVAMALKEDSLNMDDPRLPGLKKLAVVMGTEGDGLSMDTISRCDYTVRIPMAPGVDSLNVAAASAVAFWQLGRRP